VGKVISADNVVVSGILRNEIIEKSSLGGNKKLQGISTVYMEVNSILNIKNDNRAMGIEFDEEDFSEEDEKLIKNLSQSKDVFPLVVKSLCPAIYGHEMLKAGIVLAILGGSAFVEKEEKFLNQNKTQ
jgi:DNA helicase MCM8